MLDNTPPLVVIIGIAIWAGTLLLVSSLNRSLKSLVALRRQRAEERHALEGFQRELLGLVHDRVSNELAHIVLRLDALALDARLSGAVTGELADISARGRDAMRWTAEAMNRLERYRPTPGEDTAASHQVADDPAYDPTVLGEDLIRILDTRLGEHGFDLHVRPTDGEERGRAASVSARQARVIAELAVNIIKHGDPSRGVELEIDQVAAGWRWRLRNGIRLDTTLPVGGRGLELAATRISRDGGSLSYEAKDSWWTVTAVIPDQGGSL